MKKLFAALLLAALPASSQAAIIHYTLQNVLFDDGTAVSGGFDYDATKFFSFENIDITTAAGPVFGGAHYGTNLLAFIPSVGFTVRDYAAGASLSLYAAGAADLAVAGTYALGIGAPGAPSASYEGLNYYTYRHVTQGAFVAAQAVPEPGMATMFGIGLAAIGIWRRRPTLR